MHEERDTIGTDELLEETSELLESLTRLVNEERLGEQPTHHTAERTMARLRACAEASQHVLGNIHQLIGHQTARNIAVQEFDGE